MTEEKKRLDGGKNDHAGLFKPGNPGGPGRPKRQTEAAYLETMLAAVPLDVWSKIVESAVQAALSGDDKARSWLSKYLVGEPSIKAPAPTQVIIQQLLNKDPVFDAAVNCLVDTRMSRLLYPLMHEDDDLRERIAENARLEIINMEERTATTQANNNNTTTNYNE